jgi:hypothetical protein
MTGEQRAYVRASGYDTHLFDVPVMVVGAPELAERWTVEESFLESSGPPRMARRRLVVCRIGGGSIDAFARRIGAGASTTGRLGRRRSEVGSIVRISDAQIRQIEQVR